MRHINSFWIILIIHLAVLVPLLIAYLLGMLWAFFT